jgi:hypothetical protein
MAVTLYTKTIGVVPNIPQLTAEIDADPTIFPKFVAPEGITFIAPNTVEIYMSDALSVGEELALDAVIASHVPNVLLSDTNASWYAEARPPLATDDFDAGVDVNDQWIDTVAGLLYICTDNTSGAAAWQQETYKSSLTETVDPSITDDETAGYTAGSYWLNTSSGQMFVCEDASVGAAVWTGIVFTPTFLAHVNNLSNPHVVTLPQLPYTSTGWDAVVNGQNALDVMVTNWEQLGGTGRFTPTTQAIFQTGLNQMTWVGGTGLIMYSDRRVEVSWSGGNVNTTGFAEGTYYIYVDQTGTVNISPVDVEPDRKQNIHLGLFYYGGTQVGTFRACGCVFDSAVTALDRYFRNLGIFIYDNSGLVTLMPAELLKVLSPSTNIQLQFILQSLSARDSDDAGTFFY